MSTNTRRRETEGGRAEMSSLPPSAGSRVTASTRGGDRASPHAAQLKPQPSVQLRWKKKKANTKAGTVRVGQRSAGLAGTTGVGRAGTCRRRQPPDVIPFLAGGRIRRALGGPRPSEGGAPGTQPTGQPRGCCAGTQTGLNLFS